MRNIFAPAFTALRMRVLTSGASHRGLVPTRRMAGAVSIPAMLTLGVAGYAVGFATASVIQIGVRGYYMRRLFSDFNVFRQLGRAVLPTVPPALLILGSRALVPDHRSLSRVIVELATYSLATVVLTWLLERNLVTELVGYLRGRGTPRPVAA